jgi:hypothetical protein
VQLLSGNDHYKQVFVRVSLDGKELVLTLPMSPYIGCSDFAFETFLLVELALSELDKKYMHIVLKSHPKTAAWMVAIAKVKGRSVTDAFVYEQRIPLPRKCEHEYASDASDTDSDCLFHGKKFVQYPDGTVFLHVELVCETRDNYCPEERMLDPSMMIHPNNNNAMEVETGGCLARVLPTADSGAAASPRKRAATCEYHVGSSDEYETGMADGYSMSSKKSETSVGQQQHAEQAVQVYQQKQAEAEAIRRDAARVLQLAANATPPLSSLRAALGKKD